MAFIRWNLLFDDVRFKFEDWNFDNCHPFTFDIVVVLLDNSVPRILEILPSVGINLDSAALAIVVAFS
jgi:hypothetical protein